MNLLDRYIAMEYSLSLRKKLHRANPTAFIYGGYDLGASGVLTIYSDKPLQDVPQVWGDYPVLYKVRGNEVPV